VKLFLRLAIGVWFMPILSMAPTPVAAQDDSAGGDKVIVKEEPKLPPGATEKFMVAAANPVAAKVGLDILKKGGSAVDAAIAVQLMLTLVEPQSSGIGGGGFLIHYNAAEKKLTAYDGRETAPAVVRGNLFLDQSGQPMEFFDAVVGGRAVGVPGVLRMLEIAHQNHGRLRWSELFVPTINLAEDGFKVTQRLYDLLVNDEFMRQETAARDYFYPKDGIPRQVGEILPNPELAETLRTIASEGADAFYRGDIPKAIIEIVRTHENPGFLSEGDFAAYEAKVREPICRAYRKFRICGMPPPTSGGLTTLQTMALLERYDLSAMEPGSAEAVHIISEASRLAFADRNEYMADSDFVDVPSKTLLSSAYILGRAKEISNDRAMIKAKAGKIPGQEGKYSPHDGHESPSTTHFTIVDDEGNVVTMTSSIENAFGSRQFVRGFFLNNQLTDFSFVPAINGKPVANRVEPRKRPRSSMSPVIVFEGRYWGGQFLVALGSPGGSRIIGYVTQALVALLDWGMTPEEAVRLPHHVNRNGPTELEKDTAAEKLLEDLEKLGHRVKVRPLNSGLHIIQQIKGGYLGGADPRREGVVLGE